LATCVARKLRKIKPAKIVVGAFAALASELLSFFYPK